MDELKKEYTLLFNGITDTIEQLEVTVKRLKLLQIKAEEAYLSLGDEEEGEPLSSEPTQPVENLQE